MVSSPLRKTGCALAVTSRMVPPWGWVRKTQERLLSKANAGAASRLVEQGGRLALPPRTLVTRSAAAVALHWAGRRGKLPSGRGCRVPSALLRVSGAAGGPLSEGCPSAGTGSRRAAAATAPRPGAQRGRGWARAQPRVLAHEARRAAGQLTESGREATTAALSRAASCQVAALGQAPTWVRSRPRGPPF